MKVKFVPQNVEFEIKPGQSVMHVAQDHDLYIKSVCKGVPSCAECRVRIVDGEHNVLPPGSEELSLIGTGHFIDRRRLSCQLKCFGDITIDLTEQIAKQQGLIGGQKKKKLAVKDDRIEDVHAIRSVSNEDEHMHDEEVRSEEHGLEESPRAPNIDHANKPHAEVVAAQHPGGAGPSRVEQKNDSNHEGGPRGRRRRRRGGGGGRGPGGGGAPHES